MKKMAVEVSFFFICIWFVFKSCSIRKVHPYTSSLICIKKNIFHHQLQQCSAITEIFSVAFAFGGIHFLDVKMININFDVVQRVVTQFVHIFVCILILESTFFYFLLCFLFSESPYILRSFNKSNDNNYLTTNPSFQFLLLKK